MDEASLERAELRAESLRVLWVKIKSLNFMLSAVDDND